MTLTSADRSSFVCSCLRQDITTWSPYAAFWAAALALSWLIPNISHPWLTFERELLVAVALIGFALSSPRRVGPRLVIPVSAPVVMAAAAVPMIQVALGVITFLGDGLMASLYLAALAGAIMSAANVDRNGRMQAIGALWAGLLAAAMVSVGIAAYQWLGLSYLNVWVLDLPPGARPFANIGQPNLLGTLIGWGLLGLFWIHLNGHARGKVAFFAALFLLVGLAMTQSRAPWVSGALCVGLAVLHRKALNLRHRWQALAVLLVAYLVMVYGWTDFNRSLGVNAGPDFSERISGGTRLLHWQTMLAAIAERPWLGWGWGQATLAQLSVVADFPASGEILGHSHNIALDLLVWNGIPLGVLLIACSGYWLWKAAKEVRRSSDVLLLMGIVVFVVHALVEYPHAYLFTLVPAGLMIGAIEAQGITRRFVIPTKIAVIVTLVVTCVVGLVVRDYIVASMNYERLRFESARVGPHRNSKPPNLPLLTQLQAFLTAQRIKELTNLDPKTLDFMRSVVDRYPTGPFMTRYAIAAVAQGRRDDAVTQLIRLCKIRPIRECQDAREAWNALADSRYPFLKDVPFPDQPR